MYHLKFLVLRFYLVDKASDLATLHLQKMNEKYQDEMPWNLTFSYGRALQHDALNSWKGVDVEKWSKIIFK